MNDVRHIEVLESNVNDQDMELFMLDLLKEDKGNLEERRTIEVDRLDKEIDDRVRHLSIRRRYDRSNDIFITISI